MIVAMVAVMEVQVVADEVIDMVAVGDGFVAATGAMNVRLVVAIAAVLGCASVGIAIALFDAMFVHMIAMHVVHVPVVQIVGVAVMLDGGVTAAGAVLVVVLLVRVARTIHGSFSFVEHGRQVDHGNSC